MLRGLASRCVFRGATPLRMTPRLYEPTSLRLQTALRATSCSRSHASEAKSMVSRKKKKQIDDAIPSSPEEIEEILAESKRIEERVHQQPNRGFTDFATSGLWSGLQLGGGTFVGCQCIDLFWQAPFHLHVISVASVAIVATTIGVGRAVVQESGRQLVEKRVFANAIESVLQSTLPLPSQTTPEQLANVPSQVKKQVISQIEDGTGFKISTLLDDKPSSTEKTTGDSSPQSFFFVRMLQGRMASMLLPNAYYVIKGVLDEFPEQESAKLSALEKAAVIRRVAVGVSNGVILGQVDNIDSLGMAVMWGFLVVVVGLVAVKQYVKYRAHSSLKALFYRPDGEARYLVAKWNVMKSKKDQWKQDREEKKAQRASVTEGEITEMSDNQTSNIYQRSKEKVRGVLDSHKPNGEPQAENSNSSRVVESIKSARIIPDRWKGKKTPPENEVEQ